MTSSVGVITRAALDDGEQPVPVVGLTSPQELLGAADHDVVRRVAVRDPGLEQLAGGDEQDQPEGVEHEGVGVDQRGTQEDEGSARDERRRCLRAAPSAGSGRGTLKPAMMMRNTKMLSTDSAFSVM
jgi:hypothetical protein